MSVSQDGTRYAVPTTAQIAAQFAPIAARARGKRVVVVQGLGFVGSAVASVIASARDQSGQPLFFVIGVDLATPGSFWKIGKLNEGLVPFKSPDIEFDRLVADGVRETRNLVATASEEAYSLAETIVVDVQLDVIDRAALSPSAIEVNLKGFQAAVRTVGRRMRPDALVLVETTVPFGSCERIVLPILIEERSARGIEEPVLLAHATERVMPGPRYVNSIRGFWRTFAGIDAPSAARAGEFLSSFVDTTAFPLRELGDTTSSELGKILENSYRAVNIAFMHEWTLLAERAGIDLWSVIDGIRVRKGTHDNIRYPGFGVGGYCLTKDSLLAQWAARNFFASDAALGMTLEALRINFEMPRHTFDLLLELFPEGVQEKTILVCGVAYLPDVGDTRNSPTELLVDDLSRTGARVVVHDSCVGSWTERPSILIRQDLNVCLSEADAIIFAVAHASYKELRIEHFPPGTRIVDACNAVTDAKAGLLRASGARLLGVGKGHWRKRNYQQ